MAAVSEALTRFMDSLDRGVTSREELERLDLVSLEAVTDPAEKDQATDALIAKLKAPTEDPRLVDALATLRTPAALDALTWASRSAPTLTRARAARRLWTIRRDPNAVANLQAVARLDADIVAEEVLPALLEIGSDDALDVAMNMVASSARRSVQASALHAISLHYGFEPYEQIATGPVWDLTLGVTSRFPSVRARSIDHLRDLVAKRRMGADDAALGIACQAEDWSNELGEIVAASQDATRPFDDAALTALEGGERAWAVNLVMRSLERGEARAEKALETLGGERAKLALADWRAGNLDPE